MRYYFGLLIDKKFGESKEQSCVIKVCKKLVEHKNMVNNQPIAWRKISKINRMFFRIN
jgi:hypothetical protein